MFRFDWVPEDKLQETNKLETIILTEGDATFEILKTYDKERDGSPMFTKDGTPQFKLMLAVTDSSRNKGLVWHNISAKMPWAVKQLADSVAMPQLYSKSGQLNVGLLEGKKGRCTIETQTGQGAYSDKTVIKKYIPHPELNMLQNNMPQDPVGHDLDDLPF